jgi:hypothetical protein
MNVEASDCIKESNVAYIEPFALPKEWEFSGLHPFALEQQNFQLEHSSSLRILWDELRSRPMMQNIKQKGNVDSRNLNLTQGHREKKTLIREDAENPGRVETIFTF